MRVIAKDIGGSFGIKVHVYADEMATAALSVMLRRPVKFVADRLESFVYAILAPVFFATVPGSITFTISGRRGSALVSRMWIRVELMPGTTR